MHVIHFDKAYAQRVLSAIQSGQPLPAGEGGWTGNNMLTLAGVLFASVMTQGPHTRQMLGDAAPALERMHPERREALDDTFEKDLRDAVAFLGMLTLKVLDDEYDADCEPQVKAVIYQRPEGGAAFAPVEGFK